MNKCFIYCIKNPITNEVKYVGQSSVGEKRFKTHIYFAKTKNKTPVQKFINKHLKNGVLPIFLILEYCNYEQLNDKEIEYIKNYKSDGIKLLNLTDGGEGTKGRIASNETRIKMRLSSIGRKNSEEHILKSSVTFFKKGEVSWNKGIKMSTECVKKMSASRKGKPIFGNRIKVVCNEIVFDSVKDAAKHYGLSSASIVNYCKGKNKNKDNLIFQYLK